MTTPIDTASARWLAGQCDWFATLPRLTREDAALFADAGRMLAALADALDDARQTIGVQKAALAGAATTVNRASAEVCRALDRAHAAEAEVARLREAATHVAWFLREADPHWMRVETGDGPEIATLLGLSVVLEAALGAGTDTAEEAKEDRS